MKGSKEKTLRTCCDLRSGNPESHDLVKEAQVEGIDLEGILPFFFGSLQGRAGGVPKTVDVFGQLMEVVSSGQANSHQRRNETASTTASEQCRRGSQGMKRENTKKQRRCAAVREEVESQRRGRATLSG